VSNLRLEHYAGTLSIQSTGFRVYVIRYRVQGVGCRVYQYTVQDVGFRMYLKHSADHLILEAVEARLVQNLLDLENAQPALARVVRIFPAGGFRV
jgi:hypothetical protein